MKFLMKYWALVLIAAFLAIVAVPSLLKGDRRSSRDGETKAAAPAKDPSDLTHLRRGGKQRAEKVTAKQAVKEVMETLPKKDAARKRRRDKPFDLFSGLTGESLKKAQALQDALDGNDDGAILEQAIAAAGSEDPEIRERAVEALGWVGFEALPELTELMMDPNEDVADAARGQWELALEDDEDPADRFAIAMAAMETLGNEESLSSIGMILTTTVAELVDGEDDELAAAKNRLDVMQAFVDIIDAENGNPANVAAAKEAYEDFTGEEWSGVDAAERYLNEQFDYEAAIQEEEERQAVEAQGEKPAGTEEQGDAGEHEDAEDQGDAEEQGEHGNQ